MILIMSSLLMIFLTFLKNMLVAICEEIVRNDLKINWTCFATPKGMTPKLAALMKMAGCKGIEFGSDSGSGKTLKGLGKPFTFDDIAYAAECCRKLIFPMPIILFLVGLKKTIRR